MERIRILPLGKEFQKQFTDGESHDPFDGAHDFNFGIAVMLLALHDDTFAAAQPSHRFIGARRKPKGRAGTRRSLFSRVHLASVLARAAGDAGTGGATIGGAALRTEDAAVAFRLTKIERGGPNWPDPSSVHTETLVSTAHPFAEQEVALEPGYARREDAPHEPISRRYPVPNLIRKEKEQGEPRSKDEVDG